MDTRHAPRKRFGQNFLRDQGIIDKIVRAINPQADDTVVEIGPGQGALTLPLLEKCSHLEVVELDRDLVQQLASLKATHPGLSIHQADALDFDFAQLTTNERGARSLRIVGNLPYNISTPLLFHLLTFKKHIADMHFMLQKEVVERLASPPSRKSYGRLSVMVQYFCQVQSLFPVPPTCFFPPPKVESAVVRLTPWNNINPAADNFDLFRDLVNHCFQQRRKTLRNNLRHWFAERGAANLDVEQLNLAELGLDSRVRPDTISVGQYVELANRLTRLINP